MFLDCQGDAERSLRRRRRRGSEDEVQRGDCIVQYTHRQNSGKEGSNFDTTINVKRRRVVPSRGSVGTNPISRHSSHTTV